MGVTKARANQLSGVARIYEPVFKGISKTSFLPNETAFDIALSGIFFSPITTISVSAGTVSNVRFASLDVMLFDYTAPPDEGFVDFVINNGLSTVISSVFAVSLGEVTVLKASDIVTVGSNSDFSLDGRLKITSTDSGTSTWLTVPKTDDFQIQYRMSLSEFNPNPASNGSHEIIGLYDSVTDFKWINLNCISGYPEVQYQRRNPNQTIVRTSFGYDDLIVSSPSPIIRLDKTGNEFSVRNSSNIQAGASAIVDFENDITIKISGRQSDLLNVIYVKTN